MTRGMNPKKAEGLRVKRGLGKGTKLRILRVQRGMSRTELSDKSGVPLRTLEKYEQFEGQINGTKLRTLCDLSKALDCKIPDIIDDDELIERFNEVK